MEPPQLDHRPHAEPRPRHGLLGADTRRRNRGQQDGTRNQILIVVKNPLNNASSHGVAHNHRSDRHGTQRPDDVLNILLQTQRVERLTGGAGTVAPKADGPRAVSLASKIWLEVLPAPGPEVAPVDEQHGGVTRFLHRFHPNRLQLQHRSSLLLVHAISRPGMPNYFLFFSSTGSDQFALAAERRVLLSSTWVTSSISLIAMSSTWRLCQSSIPVPLTHWLKAPSAGPQWTWKSTT